MNEKEIIEYNKRCSEFLDAEHYIPKCWHRFPRYKEHYYFKNRYEPNRFTLKMMKFHLDWNWIMEMVDAIESLDNGIYSVTISNKICKIDTDNEEILWERAKSKKEAVVETINQFLIWYEQTK